MQPTQKAARLISSVMSQKNVMKRPDRFLNIYGIILLIFFLSCLYTFYISLNIEYLKIDFYIFGIAVSLWYLATGIGILLRKKWGYYLFKSFLYFCLLLFPVGTLISFYSLRYIRKNDIINQFR